uniref:DEAD box protein 1 n=1 Tax=Chromera velia CCMP2878 TaxID=1169474 RepID=A0A0G4F4K4_9ALVE|eukprot:Cvel_15043.t1-p1 / transcript=Cvel_15043.t1 / gene=Cvel_15043 / organism=Chromera_velia_CCMP2878 / gene_product=ATP-dependent RNA helicase DDX1, putative / transcript_product=ATP-dependent RNA helicase DDX1, putative / location=Cvel_scaffold1095:46051-50241(+) / protein_length=793 / sequence_SO=supercontig / SO=protein_coding / is_pseudo=false
MSAFEELGMCPEIIQAIEEDGWLLPTPVQAEAVPLILGGGDVCAAAETGSGKTGAFGLPCLQIVHEALRNKALTSFKKGGGSGSAGVEVKLSIDDKDAFVLVSEDGTEAKSDDNRRWSGIRGSADVLRGKYMYEVEITTQDSLCRLGWATQFAMLELGKDDKSFGYGGTGKKSWNGTFEDYGGPFGFEDVIGCLLDRSEGTHTVSYYKNGKPLGEAFKLPPAMTHTGLRPGICGKKFEVKCNFTNLKHPVAGYTPLGQLDASHTSAGLSGATGVQGRAKRPPLCVILEPTRDLAEQTYKCMTHFGKYLDAPPVRVGLFVGGVEEKKQLELLEYGVDVVVGTLSKVMEHVSRQRLDLSALRFLVLDEADDLMKNDDRKQIPTIKRRAEAGAPGGERKRLQTLFFSATLHGPEVRQAIESLCDKPTWVDLKGRPSIPDTVHFVRYAIDPRRPLPLLKSASKTSTPPALSRPQTDGVHARDDTRPQQTTPEAFSENIKFQKPQALVLIADALRMETCLVFCRTNLDCDNLEKYLNQLGGGRGFSGKAETGKENPYSCVVLAGMRQQEERRRNLEHFKSGDVRFLICTDVAARGLDIKELPFLMMMTLPDDPDQFFHRVGRVGRADRMGLAVSLSASEKEKVWYHKCPNRGRGCENTRLVEQGGCTIWYDEPGYLKAIEERVGKQIPVMDPLDLSVEGVLSPSSGQPGQGKGEEGAGVRERSRRTSAGGGAGAGGTQPGVAGKAGAMVMYGKAREDAGMKETLAHLKSLSPAVQKLLELEAAAQTQFAKAAAGQWAN